MLPDGLVHRGKQCRKQTASGKVKQKVQKGAQHCRENKPGSLPHRNGSFHHKHPFIP